MRTFIDQVRFSPLSIAIPSMYPYSEGLSKCFQTIHASPRSTKRLKRYGVCDNHIEGRWPMVSMGAKLGASHSPSLVDGIHIQKIHPTAEEVFSQLSIISHFHWSTQLAINIYHDNIGLSVFTRQSSTLPGDVYASGINEMIIAILKCRVVTLLEPGLIGFAGFELSTPPSPLPPQTDFL